jgi:hypothetical protein
VGEREDAVVDEVAKMEQPACVKILPSGLVE